MKKIFLLTMLPIILALAATCQNVGIGTTTPSYPLSVKAAGVGISQESPDGLTKLGFYTVNGVAYLQTHTNHDLGFSTNNGTIQMLLKTSGNFGIRNNSPNASLSVGRGTGTDGTAAFFGTDNVTHFNYSTTENTYIRAGKNNASVIINDIPGGKVGIGMNNPTRAMLEQYGSVSATTAIFGGDGAGLSLQKNWPAIGFNSYLDGAGHKAIAPGYGAQLGLNQINGSFYLVSFPYNATPNTTFASFSQRFYVSRFGQIGIGTDVPFSDIHVVQRNFTNTNENTDMGLTLEGTGGYDGIPNSTNNSKWNMHVGYGTDGNFAGLYFLSFWNNFNSGGWNRAATISPSGAYLQYSDGNRKKDIAYLSNGSLEKIMVLRPAKYHSKEEPQESEFSYGFIAQDVEKIFPEFVTSFYDTKMMNYSGLIPILTKGIQEQEGKIQLLIEENEDLKARVERLEKIMLQRQQ